MDWRYITLPFLLGALVALLLFVTVPAHAGGRPWLNKGKTQIEQEVEISPKIVTSTPVDVEVSAPVQIEHKRSRLERPGAASIAFSECTNGGSVSTQGLGGSVGGQSKICELAVASRLAMMTGNMKGAKALAREAAKVARERTGRFWSVVRRIPLLRHLL